MIRILKYFTKRETLLALLAVVLIVLQVWLEMTMPGYMSEITQLVQTEGSEMSDILSAGGKMLLCALGSLAGSILTAVCSAKISSDFSCNVRSRLFNRVQSFSIGNIGKFSTSSLITRSTNDVMQVQMLIVMGLQMLIKAPVTAIWAICKIAGKEWQWTLTTAVAVVVLLLIVGTCILLSFPKFTKMQKLTDDLNRVTRENLTGISVVRAYNAEEYQEEKFEEVNDRVTKTYLFTQRVMSLMTPSITMIMSGISLAVYWIGAYLIEHSGFADRIGIFSDMVVFSQYAVYTVMAFMMLVMIFMMLPRASVSAKRILEVLDTEPEIEDGPEKQGKAGETGEIEFRNVSFRYPDAEGCAIENITFSAKKGETVAIIGATGCGKSSVINLIPRFYDATDGEVLVDGVNVKNYDQTALRDKIGYVSQKAILFTGDIKTNIAYGENGQEPATDEQVEEAIDIAQATEFVDTLPDGIESYVAQGGNNYSGGQKQRLSIARAVCRNPEILIFDDSFSALDYKTDRTLRKTLDEKCKDTTRLIVAQRIGTIRDADKIIVLEDGKIAGMGKHDELMKNCEVYREIALSQLSKEELE